MPPSAAYWGTAGAKERPRFSLVGLSATLVVTGGRQVWPFPFPFSLGPLENRRRTVGMRARVAGGRR